MPKQYKEALRNAPFWVRLAYASYRVLPNGIRTRRPFLYHLTGEKATRPFKMSKRASRYTDQSTTEGQRCENCRFAYFRLKNKVYICSQISGRILPLGWCKLWKA